MDGVFSAASVSFAPSGGSGALLLVRGFWNEMRYPACGSTTAVFWGPSQRSNLHSAFNLVLPPQVRSWEVSGRRIVHSTLACGTLHQLGRETTDLIIPEPDAQPRG
jgi:hypothetical protein